MDDQREARKREIVIKSNCKNIVKKIKKRLMNSFVEMQT